jgi:ribosomal protein S18 acetylase RimI-like enzyme
MWEQLNKGQIHKLKNLLADYGHRSVNILDKWSAKTGLFSPFLWRAWRHSGPKEECFLFVHGEYLVMPLGFQSHLPALPRSAKDHLERREIPITLVGFESQVLSLLQGLRRSPYDRILYDYFLGPEPDLVDKIIPSHPEYRTVRLTQREAAKFFPLREEYEKEEVNIKGHRWDRDFSWKKWRSTLQSYLFLGIESASGDPLGMAGLNALSLGYAQLGGVYVKPNHRQQGVGLFAIKSLMSLMAGSNLRTCLYVKKSNMAAQNLYHALGFHKVGDFTIAYL